MTIMQWDKFFTIKWDENSNIGDKSITNLVVHACRNNAYDNGNHASDANQCARQTKNYSLFRHVHISVLWKRYPPWLRHWPPRFSSISSRPFPPQCRRVSKKLYENVPHRLGRLRYKRWCSGEWGKENCDLHGDWDEVVPTTKQQDEANDDANLELRFRGFESGNTTRTCCYGE